MEVSRRRWLWVIAAIASIVVSCQGSTASPVDGGPDATTPSSDSGVVADVNVNANDAQATDASVISDASSDAPAGICSLPRVIGPCDAAIPRYWFNAVTGRCESFTYGGCGGNANNFTTVEACVGACAGAVANPCTIVDCPVGKRCVFRAMKPVCAAPCTDAGTCPIISEACVCGGSCPACKDCLSVCLPP